MHHDKEKGFIHEEMTRRNFFRLLQCTGAGVLLGWKNPALPKNKPRPVGDVTTYKRMLRGHVVHVRDDDATYWDFSTGWYGYHVDQSVVDAMVEEGLKALTSTNSVSAAWGQLVPKYVTGQTFAIKVNFNNYNVGGPDPDPDIGALIEPINALVKTMVTFGIPETDISVYDVTNGYHSGSMPKISFMDRCLFPGVKFVYHYGNPDPYSATEMIHFDPPGTPSIPDLAIANVVVDTDYIINMPIAKAHSLAGTTLGFKNHLGTFNKPQKVHSWYPYSYYYDPDYSPHIDIFKNHNIGPKSILTIGDVLFGNWPGVSGTPKRWKSFGNMAPSSLFFAADPVAIDSVLIDFLDEEWVQQGWGHVMAESRDFLVLAQKERWGIHEHGDPWKLPAGSGYKKIKYTYINGV
jgi:hypothetical protein